MNDNMNHMRHNDNEMTALIMAYIEDLLPQDERQKIELRRKQDPAFDVAVVEFINLKKGLEEIGKAELKEKIKQWETEQMEKNSSNYYTLRIAAGFIILLLAGFVAVVLMRPDPPAFDQIAEAQFEPYPNMITTRGLDVDAQLRALLNHYDQGDYNALLEAVDYPTLLEKKSLEEKEEFQLFYVAEAQMALGHHYKASDLYLYFDSRDHAFFEVARFHRALALLLAQEMTEARNLLVQISAEKGAYREQATLLLRELDESRD